MPPAARQTDMHTCPKIEPGPVPHVGGPIQSGSSDVEIEFLPAARASDDMALCAAGGPDKIAQGCGTVSINFKPAARVGDLTSHGGVITGGARTVDIGVAGDAVTTEPIGGAASAAPAAGPEGSGSSASAEGTEGADQADPSDAKERPGADDGYPHAVIAIDRSIDGPHVLGEAITLRSDSYDDGAGTGGDAGITSHKWKFKVNGSDLLPELNRDQVEPPQRVVLNREGVYSFTLQVRDADMNVDETTTNIVVGTMCEQYAQELDELESNIEAWIGDHEGSWQSRMLAHYMTGNGGTLKVEPSEMRSLLEALLTSGVYDVEERHARELLVRKAVPALRGLSPNQGFASVTGKWSDSFNFNPVINPSGFFASGGGIVTTTMWAEVGRGVDNFYVHADFQHEWYDNYNWDVGKGYPFIPNSQRWTAGVKDHAFVLLRHCRGKGKDFDMRATWGHSAHFRCSDDAAAWIERPDLWSYIWATADYHAD